MANVKEGSRTPWGKADYVRYVAPGIAVVSTPSHGGVKLDRARNALVHEAWRGKGGWYEEDLWANVPIFTFPDLPWPCEPKGAAALKESAARTLKDWYPDEYTAATGEVLTEADSRELRDRAFKAATAGNFLPTTAYGAFHPSVPAGYVGVLGVRASDGASAAFLLPEDKYEGGHTILDGFPSWTDR